jgi:uncharacterized protein (DUF302 family)
MPATGLIDKPSNYSVEETLRRAQEFLAAKGITVFALIDHSGEAQKVRIEMLPTKLLIFGNPKGGTPLMLAAPSIAIDLPLKLLIWQDAEGNVWVTYNASAYLAGRHGIPANLMQNIGVVEMLATHSAG